MKIVTAKLIRTMTVLAALILSVDGMAAIPYPNELFQNDDLLDLTQFGEHFESHFAEQDDSGISAKYDMRRKIDRHTIDQQNPMFALNAIGKVTAAKVTEGNPGFVESAKSEENRAWGTGFMISPCHMITDYHVVCEKELYNGKKICKNDETLKSKSANFSFGENSDGSDFKKRVTGKVIASNQSLDYAIVQIDSLKNSPEEISFIMPNFRDISVINNQISLGAGYPIQSLNENSHKLYGMKARLNAKSMFINGKITFTPGNSGSPTLYTKNGRLSASGLLSSSSTDSNGKPSLNKSVEIIGFPSIGRDLNINNPSVFKDIVSSIKSGRCN